MIQLFLSFLMFNYNIENKNITIQSNLYCFYETRHDTITLNCLVTLKNNSIDTFYYPITYSQLIEGNYVKQKYPPRVFKLEKLNSIEKYTSSSETVDSFLAINPGKTIVIEYKSLFVNKGYDNENVIYIHDIVINNLASCKSTIGQKEIIKLTELYPPNINSTNIRFKVIIKNDKIEQITSIED